MVARIANYGDSSILSPILIFVCLQALAVQALKRWPQWINQVVTAILIAYTASMLEFDLINTYQSLSRENLLIVGHSFFVFPVLTVNCYVRWFHSAFT